jgi:molybdenum cofactor cytidylyltransferase
MQEGPARGVSIAGLVLAGGQSERLGRPKQLLPYRGTTLLEWVVAEVCRATLLDRVVVVLNPALAEWALERDWGRATLVVAEQVGAGCSASYRAGLDAVAAEAEAVTVVLGDQPGVSAAVIDRLASAWLERRAPVALVRYRGELGHPLLFGRELFGELAALRGDKAAWKLVDRLLGSALVVDVDAPYPRDVDTWADYQALLEESL